MFSKPIRVVLAELNVYERITPLVSGYLRAYAESDSEVRNSYHFQFYTATTRTDRRRILSELLALDANIYAFSSYVWNSRLCHWLATQIKISLPHSHIVLGGPQVVGQFKYLDQHLEGLFICNGEGEQTFRNFLLEALQPVPDFTQVRGLSFYLTGEAVTTPAQDSLKRLDDIPSPFLSDYFATGEYTFTTFETNRNCPFACTFCFWGRGEDKVVKFDEQRVRDELTWIADHSIISLYLADANFGMLKRDVQLAQHIAKLKLQTGFPAIFNFNTAKNKPERVVEIAHIVQSAGISGSQSVAIQSLDDGVLQRIRRENIKLETYTKIQRSLNDAGFGTFTELIWPLPGETIHTFKSGVDRLVGAGAQTFMMHPLALLQNTEMWDRRAEHGFRVRNESEDAASEYELVVSTNEITTDEYISGQRFIHAVNALYNYRAGSFLQRYLQSQLGIQPSALFSAFVRFCAGHDELSYVRRMEAALSSFRFAEHHNYWGEYFHHLAHAGRAEFDRSVQTFARSQPWWGEEVRTIVELDLLNRPYVYSNTPITVAADFESLQVRVHARGYEVTVPRYWRRFVAELVRPGSDPCSKYLVNHDRGQLPYLAHAGDERNHSHCFSAFLRIVDLMPVWSPYEPTKSDAPGTSATSEFAYA